MTKRSFKSKIKSRKINVETDPTQIEDHTVIPENHDLEDK